MKVSLGSSLFTSCIASPVDGDLPFFLIRVFFSFLAALSCLSLAFCPFGSATFGEFYPRTLARAARSLNEIIRTSPGLNLSPLSLLVRRGESSPPGLPTDDEGGLAPLADTAIFVLPSSAGSPRGLLTFYVRELALLRQGVANEFHTYRE
jgi:hypothetical protein